MTRSRARYGVLGLMLGLVAVAYLDRVCIATAAPTIRRELGLDAEQMGFVFSAFTFAYAIFEVPSGYFADRFGPRLALTRIVVWWSAMTAATGLAGGFASLLAVRFLFGLGEAGTFPSMTRVYDRWLPERERGWAFGLSIATGAIAGALTMQLAVWLVGLAGWRVAFAIFGSVGLLWAAAFWAYFRDDPRDHPSVSAAELAVIAAEGCAPTPATAGLPLTPQIPGVDPVFRRSGKHSAKFERVISSDNPSRAVFPKGLLRFRALPALSLMYLGAIYGWYFYLTWLPTYLLEARGLDLAKMGVFSSLPLLGIAAGVFAGGWASDHAAARFGSRARAWPGIAGFPLASVATIGAAVVPGSVPAALLLTAAAGLGAVGVAPAWSVCLELGGRRAGVVSGTMNMLGNFGGTLCPLVVGACVKHLGSWPLALASVAAFYALAAFMWAIVDVDG